MVMKMTSKPTIAVLTDERRNQVLDAASACWTEDELQIDPDARVIDNESDGYWVQAWVFVSYDESGLEE